MRRCKVPFHDRIYKGALHVALSFVQIHLEGSDVSVLAKLVSKEPW